jgi:hypothetical protein
MQISGLFNFSDLKMCRESGCLRDRHDSHRRGTRDRGMRWRIASQRMAVVENENAQSLTGERKVPFHGDGYASVRANSAGAVEKRVVFVDRLAVVQETARHAAKPTPPSSLSPLSSSYAITAA